jgi:PIN domain nuclease of toxin-antitoxin system
MTVLLDTHVLKWWLDDPVRLSESAKRIIENSLNSIVVSAVVPWELAIKTNVGKLRVHELLANWMNKMVEEGFLELPIDSSHAIRAGLLPLHHKDPFDRVLVAQAQATGWPIISADSVFEHYGVRRIW